jgi:cytochrome c-type biogenesis protein CcmH
MLLKSAPPGAPWTVQVRNYVEDLAKEQHIDLTGKLPPAPAASAAPAGPNGAQVGAAGRMSDADRQAMIHSMVHKLAGELKANPKHSGGWVRLMRAHIVLGEPDKATQAYRDARKAFAGTPRGAGRVAGSGELFGDTRRLATCNVSMDGLEPPIQRRAERGHNTRLLPWMAGSSPAMVKLD